MAKVGQDTCGFNYYPECPYADNEGVEIQDCKCILLRGDPNACGTEYWCAIAQQYRTCPYGDENTTLEEIEKR
jgi:hypothetical protein